MSYIRRSPPPRPRAPRLSHGAADRVARHLCGRHGDAEDLVQDTFERVLRRPRVRDRQRVRLPRAGRAQHPPQPPALRRQPRAHHRAARGLRARRPRRRGPSDQRAARARGARRRRRAAQGASARPSCSSTSTATAPATPRASSASPRARCTAVCTGAARRSPARAGREAMPGQMTLADGARLRVRPIVPADREPLADAFARLSDRSRHQRFLGAQAAAQRARARLPHRRRPRHATRRSSPSTRRPGTSSAIGRYATGSGGRRRWPTWRWPSPTPGSAAASATPSRCASSSGPARTASRA